MGLRGSIALCVAYAAIAACGDDDAVRTDAGEPDAGPRMPLTLRAGDESGALVVDTDPLRIRLEDADGSAVLVSASDGAIVLGVTGGGDERYHSPVEATPRGVTFVPIDRAVEARGATGAIVDAGGRRFEISVEPLGDRAYRFRVAPVSGTEDVALIRLRLASDDGGYHGLGERFHGPDARGTIVPMQLAIGGTASGLNEHHVPVPFVVSTGGYGVFVESREAGAFDVAATAPEEVRATFEGDALDVVFFVDAAPNEVVARYARHTGLPRLPPRWAFAPMHWRDEWDDRAEAEGDAARIRAEDIPCTSFWIDNPWQVSYNDLTWNETQFPDPTAFLAGLRAAGYRPLLWSTPYLDAVDEGAAPANEAERLFVMAKENDWLVKMRSGEPYLSPAAPGAQGAMIDFTSAEAMAFWQGRIDPLVAMGVRAFKLDYGEDVLVEIFGARAGLVFSDGRTERELHNVYNVLYHQPYRDALDEGSTEGGFLLVRASAYGGQTVADIVWPGDLDNDFREGRDGEVGGLPAAISALQSLAASGFPSFASDTGGYRGGMPDREALLRWAEHTAFTPFLQLGGDGEHHNPWLYDAEAGAIYRRLARAHMDLVPYFRMHAIRASETGHPPVSAPALAFPSDEGARRDPYAYMLGPDLFVAPVVLPGAVDRTVHVPPGTWFHWFTGAGYTGPTDVTIPAPLGTPVVLVRQGAILPLLPDDLDTLADADPPVVDPADRPFMRAWILPAGTHEIETEEGLAIGVAHDAASTTLTVTGPPAAGDVRMQIDLSRADPPRTSVASVEAPTPIAASPDAAAVRAGCDGACWFFDGTTLWLSVRSATPSTIVVR